MLTPIHYDKLDMQEKFACFCGDNSQFSDDLIEYFGDKLDQIKVWKYDNRDTRIAIEDKAFEILFEYSALDLKDEPKATFGAYKLWRAKNAN